MLQDRTAVYVKPLGAGDTFLAATILVSEDEPSHLQFSDRVSLPLDTDLHLFFHDERGGFKEARFAMTKMDAVGSKPVAAIKMLGQPQDAERRTSSRIAVPDQMLAVCVDNERSGSLVDVSPTGVALLIDTADKTIDSWITVDIICGKKHLIGQMQVRSCIDQGDGFYRYGLMASKHENDGMRQSLNRLFLELKKAADQTPADEPSPSAAGSENKRRHLRRDWPGTARVFIREGTNIRILKVKTLDLSEGGLSFSSAQTILEGQTVLFERPGTEKSFCINGVVRSVRVIDKARYRIGLQFQGKPLMNIEIPEQIKALMHESAVAA